MKIGLIGYFGSGAYSDDLIEHVTKRLLLEQRSDLTFDSSIMFNPRANDPDYLNSFDLLIHCGGSLLGKCTHPPIRDIARWAGKLRKPLVTFGIGYRFEPDKEPLAPEMRERIRLLFDKSTIVTVRGGHTVKHLKENGIDTSKISSLADPVIACDIPLERTPTHIVGNVRDMPSVEIQHSTTQNVHRLFAECYDWLIDTYDLPLLLVSWRHNIESDNDVIGANKVKAQMRNSRDVSVASAPSYLEAVKLMRLSRFYFGQRLHPTVYAATRGIPFVGVEYQFDKMLDWAGTVGVDNMINTKDATLESFIEAHKRVEGNMVRLRETLPAKVSEIKETTKKIVELI